MALQQVGLYFSWVYCLSPSPATILAVVGLFMNHGLGYVKSGESGRLSYWPAGLILMSVLLFLFQPEFNLEQVMRSFDLHTVCVCGVDISFLLPLSLSLHPSLPLPPSVPPSLPPSLPLSLS